MLIALEIPNEFIEHYNQDKFCDSLKRVEYDIKPCLVPSTVLFVVAVSLPLYALFCLFVGGQVHV